MKKNIRLFWVLTALVVKLQGVHAQAENDGRLMLQEKQALQEKGKQQVNKLKGVISTLVDSDIDREERVSIVVPEAIFLFDSERNKIYEIRSLHDANNVKEWFIRKYFEDLIDRRSYDRIQISWYKVNVISSLKELPNGDSDKIKYEAIIKIFQLYTAYAKHEGREKVVYVDKTVKMVNVIIEKQMECIGSNGHNTGCWLVKLGDVETEAIFAGR